jgi:tetratricopeptide (TPR) repeat protein
MKLYIILTLSIALFLIACDDPTNSANQSSQSNATAVMVPKLLDRSEKIRMGKEWDEVQNYYTDQRDAIKKNPDDLEAALKLSELFIREARVTGEHGHYYPAALSLTDEILMRDSINQDLIFRALTTKAGVQLSLHEFSDALETAQEAIKINNKNAQIYGVLVDCNVELGNYKKAIALADKMVNIKPDIRSYSRIAYLREIHGDVEGSKEALGLAIRAGYPGYEETAWAMQTLGDMYLEYGEYDNAEKIYSQILDMREDYPFAVAGIGDVAFAKGDMKSAEEKYNEAINIIPEVGYYTSLAELYKKQNRKEELDSLMAEVFVMLKDDVDSGHNMNLEYAYIYRDILQNYDKALEYGELEYRKRPKNIDVNRMLAHIYALKSDKDLAQRHLDAAIVTSSQNPEIAEIKELF